MKKKKITIEELSTLRFIAINPKYFEPPKNTDLKIIVDKVNINRKYISAYIAKNQTTHNPLIEKEFALKKYLSKYYASRE